MLKKLARRLPFINKIITQRDYYQREFEKYKVWVPPGHFYSPVVSVEEFDAYKDQLYRNRTLQGINLNEERQKKLCEQFAAYYSQASYPETSQAGFRYYYGNNFFRYFDALTLYNFIRLFNPKRIIEVGSGYSSAVILDTNERFCDNQIQLTFIEPYPERLQSLLKATDKIQLIENKLQNVDKTLFYQLEENDILFIDSTHVSKPGSDVNTLFFEILPLLKKGVFIHVHDIFFPFEYPEQWIYEGRTWNEIYLVRAFLQHNRDFSIQFFNSYVGTFYQEFLQKNMPLCLKDTGGSLWIRKEA